MRRENILDFSMAVQRSLLDGKVSRPMSLKGWHVVIATFGVLWIYRSTSGIASNNAFNWAAWLTWLSLTVIFNFRSAGAVGHGFSAAHNFARASAGAAMLVALSNISILQDGTVSALSVMILIALAISVYFVSGLVTSLRPLAEGLEDTRERSLAEALDIWLPVGLGSVVVRDLRIIRFAIWPARRPQSGDGTSPMLFSNHFVARPILIALLAIAVVELAVGHILLRSLLPWISVVHLAFGAFFILYVVGIIRSFTALPTKVEGGVLRIRMSVFFDAATPISNIRAVTRISSMPADESGSIANAAIVVAPNLLVELIASVQVDRLFKGTKSARAIALYVDDPEEFMTCLNSRGINSEGIPNGTGS
jgi:hypothetical protein